MSHFIHISSCGSSFLLYPEQRAAGQQRDSSVFDEEAETVIVTECSFLDVIVEL